MTAKVDIMLDSDVMAHQCRVYHTSARAEQIIYSSVTDYPVCVTALI